MADIKIGVKEGEAYQWNVAIFNQAFDEAMEFLNEDQYAHLARQVKELAAQNEPTQSDTVDVRPIEDYWEIRDKGGILKKINARIFFFMDKKTRTIVVLGAFKKDNDGATPEWVKRRIKKRKKEYLGQREKRKE